MGNLLRQDQQLEKALTCITEIQVFLKGIRSESTLFLKYCDPVKLNQYCKSSRGDVFRVESSWRSFTDQQALYNKTRLGPGAGGAHVTNAQAGDSFHNWGLAVDLIFTRTGYDTAFYDGKYYEYKDLRKLYEDTGIVKYARGCGLRWMGDDTVLPDVAHFECYQLPERTYRLQEKAVPGWWDGNMENTAEGVVMPRSYVKWGILAAAAGMGYLLLKKKR